MRERDGMAALFDSLIFLAVVAMVSVALLAASSPRPDVPTGEASTELDAVHEALLRCTVPVAPEKYCPLMEAVVQQDGVTAPVERFVTVALADLLPTMWWRWSVTTPTSQTVVGEEVPDGLDVLASAVRIPAPEGEVIIVLQAWAR